MNPTQPTKLIWLLVLLVAWAFFGLAGRDAWKMEEAVALGQVFDWHAGRLSAWSLPVPLYSVTAGCLAAWLPGPVDFQDAARQASGLFAVLALLFTGLAARALFGVGFGPAAMLALMGSFGLMLQAHALLPDMALLANWALLFWGLAAGRQRSDQGALIIGLALTGLALGMHGLPDLAFGLVVLLLPLLFRPWRERAYLGALVQGLVLAAVLLALVLAWLAWTGHLTTWWQAHGALPKGAWRSPGRLFSDLGWAGWPLWPLALAGIWHAHRRLGRTPELQPLLSGLPVVLLAALLPLWSRDGGLLPALVPLTLLAVYGLDNLRRGAAQGLYWFGVLCFLFFTTAFWIYFAAIEWGWPARLSRHLAKLLPAYRPGSVAAPYVYLAAFATVLWVIAIPLFPRAKIRPVLVWATGMGLSWVLIVALFRPWIETGWAYRPLVADLALHLPAKACVRGEVDPGMRVMLRYYLPRASGGNCGYTLRLVRRGAAGANPGQVVWEGRRPGMKNQVYRLERRER